MEKNTRVWIIGTSSILALAAATPAAAETTVTTRNQRTTVANRDRDPDRAVSTTRTTSYVADGSARRDVVESRAEERRVVEGKSFTVAPLFGYTTNGYGLGVGARLGYTFQTPVYLGANFMYQAGDSGTNSSIYPSAELGYDIGVGPMLFRPYGGVGAHVLSRTTAGSNTTALVYPGLAVHYLIPRSPAFVGGDAKVLIPVDRSAAVSLGATTGLMF